MSVDPSRSLRQTACLCTMFVTLSAIAACESSVSGLQDDRTLHGRLLYSVADFNIMESFPVQISVTIDITNVGFTPARAVFPDGCVVLLRAYGAADEPSWDMGQGRACTEALVEVEVGPGERRQFQSGVANATEILGDSLPSGVYRITAYLRPGETIELEAGQADLIRLPIP